MPRVRAVARALTRALIAVSCASIPACEQGDVGAPCNHGTVEPPSTKLVTFPALSCDDLLCVYGEEHTVPSKACDSDDDCNTIGSRPIFACEKADEQDQGRCTLALDYVLERSMCSKRCESDADCKDAGPGPDPVAKDTACRSGFSCARIQPLGEFCCEKLCVCNDELPDTSELDEACERDMQPGCPQSM